MRSFLVKMLVNCMYGYILCLVVFPQICLSNVKVSVQILSYTNHNGTSYVAAASDRKCCDGAQRGDCLTGDTCDTYFSICVGRLEPQYVCNGASMMSSPYVDTNNISNSAVLTGYATTWNDAFLVYVYIGDDDSNGSTQVHDHIDTLIDELMFRPAASDANADKYNFEWQGKTSLMIALSAQCSDGYYGKFCEEHCQGLKPMALCDEAGKLSCQPSGELLLEFVKPINKSMYPDLIYAVNHFVQYKICQNNQTSHTPVYYPTLNIDSNTMSFTANCNDHQVTAIEFETILQLQSQHTLTSYFSPGVIVGPSTSEIGYGEHIKPNVLIGIELLHLDNPSGTSYDGQRTSGERRCCDVPSTGSCATATDTCDMQVTVCIGEMLSTGVCIGSVSIFPVFPDTTSISTCGPALLDNTNSMASVAHPIVGGMRLVQNEVSVQVIIKDIDLAGNSSDVIDMMGHNITVLPGANVTHSSSFDVTLKNNATLTLRLMFWCADGHSGPLCHADQGTDKCQPGWHGDECEIQYNACDPSPCLNGGQCVLPQPNSRNICQCPEGYTGVTCEHDIDECELHICQHNATCQNSPGAFNCVCSSMWDGLICTDSRLPICMPDPCSNGKCFPDESNIDDYRCLCDQGYTGHNCNVRMSGCTTCQHGDCRLINNEDTCVCHFGYGGNDCTQDINECDARPCMNGATCHNTYGNFSCECPTGYRGQLCGHAYGSCSGHVCDNNGTCLDIGDGSYLCMCPADYTGDTCQTHQDICAQVTCSNNGTCVNVDDVGGFGCTCTSGWSGKTCDVDVNECSQSPCVNGNCTNTLGSYSCSCQFGWTGQNCDMNINECISAPGHMCTHGQCINVDVGYACNCSAGYTGQYCDTKLTYCLQDPCHQHGMCVELPNGHSCQCNAGYTGTNCDTDVDECSQNICNGHSDNCTNTPGSYTCHCYTGWTGSNCDQDVNECVATKVIPCSGNGICANTDGSYTCTCFEGFIGKDCEIFQDTCARSDCKNNGTCLLKNSETRCVCPPSWTGISCEDDLNECEDVQSCSSAGQCENTDGSYYCTCISGWTGPKCDSDVNECISNVCQNNGVCSNSPGSYKCACQTGWEGMSCEVKYDISMAGVRLRFDFKEAITNDITQSIISYTHNFLATSLCNTTGLVYSQEVFRDNYFEVVTNCSVADVSQTLINMTLGNMSDVTISHLFPLTLQDIQLVEKQATIPTTSSRTIHSVSQRSTSSLSTQHATRITSSTTQRHKVTHQTHTVTSSRNNTESATSSTSSADKKSWAAKYWPAFVGGAAAIIIVLVVVGGILRDRRKRQEEKDGFNNPTFSSDHSEMHHYDTMHSS